MNDSTSIVRVTQYMKEITGRDPVSSAPVRYEVPLDWGIGRADDGDEGYYFYGSPYQFFTETGTGAIYGDPTADSRVLITRERMTLSALSSASAGGFGSDTVHFKHPNI